MDTCDTSTADRLSSRGLPEPVLMALVNQRALAFIRFALDREEWPCRVFRRPEQLNSALRSSVFAGLSDVDPALEVLAEYNLALEEDRWVILSISLDAPGDAQALSDRLYAGGAQSIHLFEDQSVRQIHPENAEQSESGSNTSPGNNGGSGRRSLLSARVPHRPSQATLSAPADTTVAGVERWKTMDQISQAMTSVRIPVRTLMA